MREFVRGEKARLQDLGVGARLEVDFELAFSGDHVFDVACFALDAQGRAQDRSYLLYQRRRGPIESGPDRFQLDLEQLPVHYDQLIFVVAIASPGSMNQLGHGRIALRVGDRELAAYPFEGTDFLSEKAIIAGSLYRKSGWRFSAVGQGFSQGLPALLDQIGASGLMAEFAPPLPPSAPPSTFVPDEHGGHTIVPRAVLELPGDRLVRQLFLHRPLAFLLLHAGEAPLQLSCLYVGLDGQRGVIQRAGGLQGEAERPPHLLLGEAGERGVEGPLLAFRPGEIERALLVARCPQGFAGLHAALLVQEHGGPESLIPGGRQTFDRPVWAIASLLREGPSMALQHEGQVFSSMRELDGAYGFGFDWRLGPDGSEVPGR